MRQLPFKENTHQLLIQTNNYVSITANIETTPQHKKIVFFSETKLCFFFIFPDQFYVMFMLQSVSKNVSTTF